MQFSILRTSADTGSSWTNCEQRQLETKRWADHHTGAYKAFEHERSRTTHSSQSSSSSRLADALALVHSTQCSHKNTSASLILETACLLHQSEVVVVVEYIEITMPVFFALYLVILVHLPTAKYYEDMQSVDADKLHRVVGSILLYAGLELLTLVFLNEALRRTFGLLACDQLAFTLENEWHIHESNFNSWIIVVFSFLLLHHGRCAYFLAVCLFELSTDVSGQE
ncbi:hypothetical protein Gpo141_00009474 [Globisporangium polare]